MNQKNTKCQGAENTLEIICKSIYAVLSIGNLIQSQGGNIKFVAVTLAGSQYTICSYYVGLSSTWHFYEKARKMGLEFGTFKWNTKYKAIDAVDTNVRDQMDATYPRFTGALVCLF